MSHFQVGDIIVGEFRVDAELGEGGMARVYQCLDLGLHMPVAVKVLKQEYALIPDACARFLQEARTQARLQHPNVMPVQRVLHAGELAAMVMPYFPGGSLSQHIDASPSGGLPEAEALGIFAHLLAGVRAAHESTPPVIHRDIKPDNVYLADTPTGRRILLMDFGIAKVRQEGSIRTQTGARMGTVAYMAPEQIAASKDVSFAADIFSLGVLLYEMLCGRRPFTADSDLLLPAAVVSQPVPREPLAHFNPAVRAVVLRCLEKDPTQRPQRVEILQTALLQILPRLGPATPAPLTARTASPPTPSPAPSPTSARPTTLPAGGGGPATGPPSPTPAPTPAPAEPAVSSSVQEAAATAPGPSAPVAGARANPPAAAGRAQSAPPAGPRRGPAAPAAGKRRKSSLPGGCILVAALVAAGIVLLFLLLVVLAALANKSPRKASTDGVVPEPTGADHVAPEPTPAAARSAWVRLPAGAFQMGSFLGDGDEHPVHEVQLAAFDLMSTEATVASYRACVQQGACTSPGQQHVQCNALHPDRHDHPVNCVSWHQAASFCAAAGARLPTEAEWEYAARSAQPRRYPWGDASPNCSRAIINDTGTAGLGCGASSTWPACSRPAGNSAQGACDLSGNVWEWVADWYAGDYYAQSARFRPSGPSSGRLRSLRGGSWSNGVANTRAADRLGRRPDLRRHNIGFRCARSVS